MLNNSYDIAYKPIIFQKDAYFVLQLKATPLKTLEQPEMPPKTNAEHMIVMRLMVYSVGFSVLGGSDIIFESYTHIPLWHVNLQVLCQNSIIIENVNNFSDTFSPFCHCMCFLQHTQTQTVFYFDPFQFGMQVDYACELGSHFIVATAGNFEAIFGFLKVKFCFFFFYTIFF